MENLKQNAMMEEAIASAEISMDTPDTEWASVDRYSVETGLLKRFFKLYEEGRKTGDPQNFIDYFKAEHYLLTEVGKAITSRDTYWKERVRDVKFDIEALRGSPRDTDIEYARAITDVHKILDDIIDNLK